MELFKKISQLCRQHYEKIILLLSLAILGGAVVFLFLERAKQENEQEKTQGKYRAAKGKAPPALNVAYYQGVLQSLQSPPKLDLGLPHHLFNPSNGSAGLRTARSFRYGPRRTADPPHW